MLPQHAVSQYHLTAISLIRSRAVVSQPPARLGRDEEEREACCTEAMHSGAQMRSGSGRSEKPFRAALFLHAEGICNFVIALLRREIGGEGASYTRHR